MQQDLIIIGGGIMGLLCARELAATGHGVTVFDAPGHPGASWAGGGILSPLFPWRHPAPVTDLCRGALPAYESLAEVIRAAGGPDPEVRRCGLLAHAPGELEQARAWAAEQGLRVEPGCGPDGFTSEPWLSLPDTGQVRNSRLLAGLRHLLRQDTGVSLREEAVHRLEPDAGAWRVHTDGGVLRARSVLVTAGAWSSAVLEPLGLDWPLMPVKGEMVRYPPGSPAPDRILLSEAGYVIPRADGSVLAGSTLEERVTDQRPTRAAAERLERAVAGLWPPLRGVTPEVQWAGLRPGTRRAAPLIGPVPGHEGLYLATGHYRYGLTAAPVTARLITALINGAVPPLDPAPYAPGPELPSSS